MGSRVTATGAVSPFGAGVRVLWSSVSGGARALRLVQTEDGSRAWIAAAEEIHTDPRSPRGTRSVQLAVAAADEAMASAKERWDPSTTALVLGTCLQGPLRDQFGHSDVDAVATSDPVSVLLTAMADRFALGGPLIAVNTACSSSLLAVIVASEIVRGGIAKSVLCGGVEEFHSAMTFGFQAMGVPDPGGPAPYSRSGGIGYGEGAGFLLLEEANGPGVYVDGWGMSLDAFHPVKPDPSGEGAVKAIQSALMESTRKATDIGYVNGHGTGTMANDEMEKTALAKVFGERRTPPLSSSKGAIGHCMGAAGALESIITVAALSQGFLPPTANFNHGIAADGFDFVPDRGRAQPCAAALKLSFAFGGHNAAVIYSKDPERSTRERPAASAKRSTISVLAEVRLDELDDMGQEKLHNVYGFEPPQHFWRRLDASARMAILLSLRLCPVPIMDSDRVGLIYVSQRGPTQAYDKYVDARLAKERASIPWLFPNTSFNAAPARVAQAFGIRGPSAAFVGGGFAGITALWFGDCLIREDRADRVIVMGLEDAVSDAQKRASGGSEIGGVAVLLSTADSTTPGLAAIAGIETGTVPPHKQDSETWNVEAQFGGDPYHGAAALAALRNVIDQSGPQKGLQQYRISGIDASGSTGSLLLKPGGS